MYILVPVCLYSLKYAILKPFSDLFSPPADLVEGPVGLGAAVVDADGTVLEGAVLGARAVDALRRVRREDHVLGVPVAHVLVVDRYQD